MEAAWTPGSTDGPRTRCSPIMSCISEAALYKPCGSREGGSLSAPNRQGGPSSQVRRPRAARVREDRRYNNKMSTEASSCRSGGRHRANGPRKGHRLIGRAQAASHPPNGNPFASRNSQMVQAPWELPRSRAHRLLEAPHEVVVPRPVGHGTSLHPASPRGAQTAVTLLLSPPHYNGQWHARGCLHRRAMWKGSNCLRRVRGRAGFKN